ncbi:hypothetical protein DMB42_35360 [Nonomuraea sp. WAC 01424]|uniref:hypothetical protein n=1 Tax=Nonomuraea sp. WAC 01424 TaxID=2203200 RepID=UPI000F78F742|nr:hypothetical protein [Nonomuraea sp. WAC 01424]RSN03110.1 hypothetical protein DMB42_35360 [Nonomuraea sp. WAC 01424]
MIQTRDKLDRKWSWVLDHGAADDGVAGSGVEDDIAGSPLSFARATFDAYLNHLIVVAPGAVDYYLFEDECDTEWRILVWDVPSTDYSRDNSVPPPGDPVRRGYARAMAVERVEPQAVCTWPGHVVRRRLHDMWRAAQKDSETVSGEDG